MHNLKLVRIFITSFILFFLACTSLQAIVLKKVEVDNRNIIQVEVVTSDEDMAKGLGYRKSLAIGKGMLFHYPDTDIRRFWMKGMFFPIDIIWIRKGTIVHIEKDVPPPRSIMINDSQLKVYDGSSYPANMILEVPAGYSQKNGFQEGQKIQILP
ncbi:MAG: uncharacterized membrane protein (UPF0127 family) [bacterium]|jgi:uncharacterized membrane protein (UPF0127 family)